MRAMRVLLLVVVVGVVAALVSGPGTRPATVGGAARPIAEIAPDLGATINAALAPVADVVERFPAVVPGTPCLSTARACIDLSANRSWLISGGKVVYGPVPITHGRPGWRTPPGTFRVAFKSINHKSTIFDDAPMPFSVFFNGGIAFHQGSLRVPSHGCIHLSPAAARQYFGTLQRGDIVQVVP
ncbi:L,D-transpeptidase [Pseudonocardia sp. CA-107938]|uniref:L,D-transpeptidase n=1 Tax=Pseudonocardia sp. CA-107938 TaxID=3240021 RepID=UPI003D8EE91E